MTILQALQTSLLKITYPDETCDPFYDQYVEGIMQQEVVMFYSKLFSNMWLSGGGTRSWNGGTGLFQWTANFLIPVFHWGKKISIVYGPDNMNRSLALADGQMLVIDCPTVMNDNVSVNFQILSQLDQDKHNQFVCGYRNGAALYLRGIGELT